MGDSSQCRRLRFARRARALRSPGLFMNFRRLVSSWCSLSFNPKPKAQAFRTIRTLPKTKRARLRLEVKRLATQPGLLMDNSEPMRERVSVVIDKPAIPRALATLLRMMARWGLAGLAACCVFGDFLPGMSVTRVTAAETVTVIDVDHRPFEGVLHEATEETLKVSGEQTREFAWDDVLFLRFGKRRATQPTPKTSVVFLANDDRLIVRPQRINEERALADWIRFPDMKAVTIPLETIRSVVLDVPEDNDVRDQVFRRATASQTGHDLLLLKNGDRFTGELIGLEADDILLDTPGGTTRIARDGVRVLAFNSELISFPPPRGRRTLLSLLDGSRVTVHHLRWESESLACETLFGTELDVPLTAIVSLQFTGGRITYLSDLDAAAYDFTPYLSERWGLHRDRNVLGGPLRVGGVEYAKGLGMHSKSQVTYDLESRYRRFHSAVGIDDQTEGRGHVAFIVEVNGRTVWSSGPVRGGSEARTTGSIDVTGAQTLRLTVDFGHHGDVQDHANWCDAVLLK